MDLNGSDPGDEVARIVVEALVDSETEPAPPPLRQRVLAGALKNRPPGRPTGVESVTPAEGYRRTVAELDDVLAGLDDDQWAAVVAPYGWTVQGLVGHLIGIERMLATRLGLDDFEVPAELEADHLGATQAVVEAQDGRDPSETLAEWRMAAENVRRALEPGSADARDMDQQVVFHGVPFRWGSLLVVRSLEVWTHTDDIRRAVGLELAAPDAARLALMTDLAVRSLPVRLAVTPEAAGASGTLRIVLTGPGGGVWQQDVGSGSGAGTDSTEPDVRIVADAVGFCRLSAGRLSAEDLGAVVEGDEDLGAAVFTASAAFAV